MNRREFITVLGATVGWPLTGRAQQPERVRRVGVLMALANDQFGQSRVAAFRQALKELGWTDGDNLRIEYRWAGGDLERTRTYAAELVGLRPDVILANTSVEVQQLKRHTNTIPIVFATIYDPVGTGFVASLARPGGNITGLSLAELSMGGKMLEVLKEMAPQINRVAVILNPEIAPNAAMRREIEAAAPSFGVRLTSGHVKDPAEIEPVIEALAREGNGGLIVLISPVITVHREKVISLAARHRLPAVYGIAAFVTSGGLVSYGVDGADLFRRAADYVDRILKGAKPGDLPVQQPTKLELMVNLKTAKALGLTVPPTLLARADEVIE